MSPTDQRAIETDRINSLLASSQRRCVLSLCAENEALTVEKLGRKVAAMEGIETDGTSDAPDRLLVSLVHNHLPRLDDHDAIDYDREAGEVTPGDRFDEIVSVLERLRLETDAKPLQVC